MDADDDATVDASGEPILKVAGQRISSYTLRTNGTYAGFLTYDSSGEANAIGRFVLCKDADTTLSRALFVNATGRP